MGSVVVVVSREGWGEWEGDWEEGDEEEAGGMRWCAERGMAVGSKASEWATIFVRVEWTAMGSFGSVGCSTGEIPSAAERRGQ